MMRLVVVAAWVVAAFALAPVGAGAEGLAEAAAKEKERRKAAQAKARVYTESDLSKGGGDVSAPSGPDAAPAPAGEAAAAPAAGAKKEKTPDEQRAEQEKAWREKLQKANEEITRLTARIESLQRALNDVSQNLYSATRTSQLSELEQSQKQLADAQQALSNLQDEGRRQGFR